MQIKNRGMSATSTSAPVILHADPEHGRLRLAIIFLLIAAVLLLFYFLNILWLAFVPPDFPDVSFFTTCVSSIVLGLVVVWAAERGLKKVWHSGRSVTLEKTALKVQDGKDTVYELAWDGHMNTLYWYFTLEGYKRGGRERRVPNRWLCLATQVQEGEHRVILYTYISPKEAESMIDDAARFPFKEIHPATVYETTTRARFSAPERPEKIPSEVLRGKEGKYWLAEQRRWSEGFELTSTDFEIFINYLG